MRKIGKRSAVAFKDALLAKPANLSTAEAALPLPEIVAKYASTDIERLSPTTVAKSLGLLSASCAWGERNGYLRANPFVGVKPAAAA